MVRRDTSVKTKLYSNGVCLRKFSRMKSGRPEPNVQHFFEKPVEDTIVGVVVPIYNEQATDLRKTLLSIDMQVGYMRSQRIEITPHIMLVQDGVSKASQSMKKYLRNMFNLDENQWKREFESEDNSAPYQTFILQILQNSNVSYVNVNAGYKTNNPVNMLITLIVKKDNRKKHNSHEWFLGESGFMAYYRPKYAFCTDCSTLFHKGCLMKLVDYMEKHPDCAVCTGRQRVMTKEMQGSPEESWFSVASMLRHAQRFDYEASFVCYTGTFSAVGFLPVVPGPCGLYRTESLIPTKEDGGYEGSASDWYFDVVNTDPDVSGLILGNLRIAEDRVLSYSVVFKARKPSVMGLVPQAVFYFEAETTIKSLVLQRRRWINGTWAGYWYLAIQHPHLVFDSAYINIFTKFCVWLLLFCQLAIYFVVALAPSIFLGALRLTLSLITQDYGDSWLLIAFWVILVLMYLYFIWHHHTNVYLGYLFNLWLLFSAILSISSIAGFVVYVVKNRRLLHPDIISNPSFKSADWCDALTIYIVVVILIFPMLIAIIADGRKSIILMIRSVVPYYVVLPMVVGFFTAYSFSRCWDLTWGNRPAEDDPAHRLAIAKVEDLKTQSATLSAIVAIANLAFFYVQVVVISDSVVGGKLYLAIAIFATTLLQMIIGFLWFSVYRVKYFFVSTYYFLKNFRHRKKFIYHTYGDEEDDSESIDVHTLYYDDNNDSDDDLGDISDDDEFEDYYDADSRAIVLVDGPLQRHMSVASISLPPNLMASRASPALKASPSPSPAVLLPPSPHGANNSRPSTPPSPRSAGVSPAPRAGIVSPQARRSVTPTNSVPILTNPIVSRKNTEQDLPPAFRPKLSRTTNSAVSFATPPATVIAHSQGSHAAAAHPSSNPELHPRIRSTSMPPLPPSFFVSPPPSALRNSSANLNNNNH